MSDCQTHGVLPQMISVVLDYLNEEKLEQGEDSFFAQELLKIHESERRDLIRTYLCDNIYFLLHGIIDQVHSLDTMLNARRPAVVAVSPYVLTRSMLEFAYKLAYLTDPHTKERIQRSLLCYYADIQEFRKLPRDLTSLSGRKLVEDQAILATEWYSDLTGGKEKIRTVMVMEIFKAVGVETYDEKGNQDLIRDGRRNLVPSVYAKGYRIYSAVSHGNLWAIEHYGLTKTGRKDDEKTALPGLNSKTVYRLQEIAGGLLMYSLGFAVQFMRGYLPSSTMNELGSQIELIQNALTSETDCTSHFQEST